MSIKSYEPVFQHGKVSLVCRCNQQIDYCSLGISGISIWFISYCFNGWITMILFIEFLFKVTEEMLPGISSIDHEGSRLAYRASVVYQPNNWEKPYILVTGVIFASSQKTGIIVILRHLQIFFLNESMCILVCCSRVNPSDSIYSN